ncbi:hypothetical protein CCMSSC00406_0005163 [Pleurotus cornucopiae]|uniref:Uncharacterized protein n=1 Tax=Pleurotus cornucopiae TaxID=5321 RepID=A0ACB7J6N5_PLECO|nr:hypothetical protein CCMSSC00406_0005163 [Pleurotus cornucopiae]
MCAPSTSSSVRTTFRPSRPKSSGVSSSSRRITPRSPKDPYFESCTAFATEFRTRFLPDREREAAMLKLESTRYHQGSQTFQKYLNEFRDLVDQSGYTKGSNITMKFRRELDSIIQSRVAESADCLDEDDFEEWYRAAVRATLIHNKCVRGPHKTASQWESQENKLTSLGMVFGFIYYCTRIVLMSTYTP